MVKKKREALCNSKDKTRYLREGERLRGCQSLKKSQRGHSSTPVTKLSGRKHVGGVITKADGEFNIFIPGFFFYPNKENLVLKLYYEKAEERRRSDNMTNLIVLARLQHVGPNMSHDYHLFKGTPRQACSPGGIN